MQHGSIHFRKDFRLADTYSRAHTHTHMGGWTGAHATRHNQIERAHTRTSTVTNEI